jgi:hypothetical protein
VSTPSVYPALQRIPPAYAFNAKLSAVDAPFVRHESYQY